MPVISSHTVTTTLTWCLSVDSPAAEWMHFLDNFAIPSADMLGLSMPRELIPRAASFTFPDGSDTPAAADLVLKLTRLNDTLDGFIDVATVTLPKALGRQGLCFVTDVSSLPANTTFGLRRVGGDFGDWEGVTVTIQFGESADASASPSSVRHEIITTLGSLDASADAAFLASGYLEVPIPEGAAVFPVYLPIPRVGYTWAVRSLSWRGTPTAAPGDQATLNVLNSVDTVNRVTFLIDASNPPTATEELVPTIATGVNKMGEIVEVYLDCSSLGTGVVAGMGLRLTFEQVVA